MKIRKVSEENLPKAVALLQASFPGSQYEAQVVQKLHEHGKTIHDWICIHINRAIAYIGFSFAYQGEEVCGLHLGPIAVNPNFQNQGVGSELLRYALRQEPIKDRTIFVLGRPDFYQRFGFSQCSKPNCPFDKDNSHFLSLRNTTTSQFTIGYESEFLNDIPAPKAPKTKGKKRKSQR
ncbi:MAG: N-acetyltransferase [Desulfobulbaceae bacterium]|nr:N-acetyltransferase [Desulfobulbaceae bacterium]